MDCDSMLCLSVTAEIICNELGCNVRCRVRCRYSGVLSAYGLALADVVEEVQEPCSLQYEQHCFGEIDQRVEQLSKRCHDTLSARGFSRLACIKCHMVQVQLSVSRSVPAYILPCQRTTHSH